MSSTAFDAWVQAELQRVEAALARWVPADAPAGLGLAMRYGVLDGGKRLRPLLVRVACEAVAGDLHAAALRFDHPIRGGTVGVASPIPEDLRALWDEVVGAPTGP